MAGRMQAAPTHIPNYFRKSRLIMLNIKLIIAIVTSALLAPILSLTATPAKAQILFGNVGSEPVSGIVGSGSKRQGSTKTVSTFDPTIQSKINAASAGLTPAAVSGTQTVLGKTVTTDPAVVQTAFDLINSPAGANTPAVAAFAQSLGNSPNAQTLATSMQGLRNSDGSIDATVMTNAVNAYNAYVQTLNVGRTSSTNGTNSSSSYSSNSSSSTPTPNSYSGSTSSTSSTGNAKYPTSPSGTTTDSTSPSQPNSTTTPRSSTSDTSSKPSSTSTGDPTANPSSVPSDDSRGRSNSYAPSNPSSGSNSYSTNTTTTTTTNPSNTSSSYSTSDASSDLPPGQKVAQVLLGKLLEAAR
jgi:hypothetical protein